MLLLSTGCGRWESLRRKEKRVSTVGRLLIRVCGLCCKPFWQSCVVYLSPCDMLNLDSPICLVTTDVCVSLRQLTFAKERWT